MKISDDDRKGSFLMALGQMALAQGEPEINLKKMASMAAEAAGRGADILCFPELSYTGYFVRKERLLEIAETEDGVFVTWLRDAAKKYGIWIGAGYAERGGEGLYNTYLLASREGDIACRARKVHLWKSEKKRFVSGHEFPVIDTEFGKIAVLICYDMEFPETVRMAGLRGAETILCPAAWSNAGKHRWEVFLQAAGLYNLLFAAGVNSSDELCCGSSAVAGPDGCFLAKAGEKEERVLTASVDRAAVTARRKEIPYYDDLSLSLLAGPAKVWEESGR